MRLYLIDNIINNIILDTGYNDNNTVITILSQNTIMIIIQF